MAGVNLPFVTPTAGVGLGTMEWLHQQQSSDHPINHSQVELNSTNGQAYFRPAEMGVEQCNQNRMNELRNRARIHVNEAIGRIPAEKKAAYLEAMERAPQIVLEESDPMQFVRRCNFDVWSAGLRLCKYWEERLDIFGPERAFLPLDLTGSGALDENDILSLQAGFPALLPKTKTGQQVVLVDRRQHVPFLTIQNRWRGAFYLANILAKDEYTQTEGVIILNILSMPRFHDYDREGMKRAFTLCRDVFPIVGKIHLINIPPDLKGSQSSRMYAVQNVISSFVSTLLDIGMKSSTIEVHFEREKGEMLAELEELGLDREGIPDFLGGNWRFEYFSSWCRSRAQEETKANPGSSKYRRQIISKCKASSLTAAETKKRAKNIIHSRQKRARRRQEASAMFEERDRLLKDNEILKAEQDRLTGLLQQAQAHVATLPTSGKKSSC